MGKSIEVFVALCQDERRPPVIHGLKDVIANAPVARFVLDQLSTYLAEPGLGMQGPPRAKPAEPTPMPTSQQVAPQHCVTQQQQSQPAPQPAASVLQQWPAATHQIAAPNTPGFPEAAGRVPSRMLPAGLPIAAYEQLPGWLHVRSIDGWDGWVAEANLIRLR